MMRDFSIEHGALAPARTDRARMAVSEDVVLTVEPDPRRTALFGRTGLKFPMGDAVGAGAPSRVRMLVGQIGDVRTHVTTRDGRLHVIMTRRNLEP